MLAQFSALLRNNRDYRYLWLGYVVSQLGDWFNLIASASLIARLTESGTQLSLLFLARFIPLFLVSPFAGILSDRFDRRAIMIASDLLRGLTVLGFLFIRDASLVWLFYLFTVLQFSLSALFTPARSSSIPNLVPKEDLITANALDSTTWSVMLAFGTLLGGLATSIFGIEVAFVLDALTFVLSAWLISRISKGVTQIDTAKADTTESYWGEMVGGMRYLWGIKALLVIALVKASGSLVWGAVNVLEIGIAEDVYPLIVPLRWFGETREIGAGGVLTLTLLYMASGIGTGIGPILFGRWFGSSINGFLRGITVAIGLMTVGMLGLSIQVSFGWFLLFTLVRNFGTGTLWVFSSALLQLVVPDRVRGRVFAFEFACLTLTQSISITLAGVMQDSLGFSLWQIFRWDAVLSVVLLGGWLLMRSVRFFDNVEPR